MIKNLLQSIILVIMSILLTISLAGCAVDAYACEVLENNLQTFYCEKDTDKNHAFRIGESTYNMQYLSSQKSSETGDTFDVYEMPKATSEVIGSKIRVNSKTGEMVEFSGISPYPDITNIDTMSDAELKQTVELMMGDLVDFSKYNHYEVERPVPGLARQAYHLKWQVKRELLCAITVKVDITLDGAITDFHKTDACPDDLTKSFLSNAERDKLIEKKIADHLGRTSLDGIEYEITSEVLSSYNNKPAINYLVKIVEDGFAQLICFVIY